MAEIEVKKLIDKIIVDAAKPDKKQPCLNCDKEKMVLKFNAETKIYEGERICYGCRRLQKNRFY